MTRTGSSMLRSSDVAGELRREFEARFGVTARLFRAPGRVNIIGEHTDYNQGFVMPAAIDLNTTIAAAATTDGRIRVVSLNLDEEHTFSIDDDEPRRSGEWHDYVQGVALMLRSAGYPITGANMLVWGDVPLGAGLSSSASVEVATAITLLHLSSVRVAASDIALLCQRAENEFVGANCGIMDQFISVNARAGNALMLDCRSLDYELVPVPHGLSLVISNTMVKHQLSGGEYNVRRAQCEEGVRILRRWKPDAHALRDFSPLEIEQHRDDLPPVIYKRCRHVVRENERVLEFARALRNEDFEAAGALMRASHQSLRDDYEVSCPELDAMVEWASRVSGTIGSRMTGGGFGGCTISLVRNDAVDRFRAEVARGYENVTGVAPDIYVSPAADGASELTA